MKLLRIVGDVFLAVAFLRAGASAIAIFYSTWSEGLDHRFPMFWYFVLLLVVGTTLEFLGRQKKDGSR